MSKLVITNNPKVQEGVGTTARVEYDECSALNLLQRVEEVVSEGGILMEDPTRGTAKYYRSIVLLEGGSERSENSYGLIQKAIAEVMASEPKPPRLVGMSQKKDLEKVMQILR